MKRKVIAAILTGTMVLSATACSSAKAASETVRSHNNAVSGEVDSYLGGDVNYEATEAGYYEATTVPDTNLSEQDFNTEEYNTIKENGFVKVSQSPLSTFAADVDTGSYCNLRRMIMQGYNLENVASAIRTEEIVNYFDYKVDSKDDVFSVQYSIGDCPWNKDNKLLVMTMQANSETNVSNEGNNFVFLIDSSGSMNSKDKLPLVKESFH